MGSGSSKPDTSAGSRHVFSSDSPVQFSSNLVDALQTNSETDSSRSRTLELQIQARVAEELDRLRQREQQTLAEIEKRLAAETRDTLTSPSSQSLQPAAPTTGNVTHTPGSLNLDAPRIPFAGREHDAVVPEDRPVDRSVSSGSVNSEVQALRRKLDGRRKLAPLDGEVEKAKGDVVSCLRVNDRRPLDCWKEVEAFKKEVARMEEKFVDRIVG